MTNRRIIESIHRANAVRRVPARAFRPDGAGSYTASVPGGNGLTYVRPDVIASAVPTGARDLVGLSSPTDDDAPVWIEPGADGIWNITERRYEG